MTKLQLELLMNTLRAEVEYQKEQLQKSILNGDDNLYHYLKGRIEANESTLQILEQTKALNEYKEGK